VRGKKRKRKKRKRERMKATKRKGKKKKQHKTLTDKVAQRTGTFARVPRGE
jgi:hypothetical protein